MDLWIFLGMRHNADDLPRMLESQQGRQLQDFS